MKITAFNKLRKYESYLTTVVKGNYIRSLTNTQIEELIAIGEEIGIKHKNNHCPKCTLEFVKKLAVPFFEQKVKLEDKKNEQKHKLEENQENEN